MHIHRDQEKMMKIEKVCGEKGSKKTKIVK